MLYEGLRVKFPDNIFTYSEKPAMIVDEKDNKIGFIDKKTIYLDFPNDKFTLDKVMSILIPLLKKYKAKTIQDEVRPDRIGFITINGYKIFFAVDLFTYKYILANYILKSKNLVSEHVKDFHTGTLGYRYLQGEIDDKYLECVREELIRESLR